MGTGDNDMVKADGSSPGVDRQVWVSGGVATRVSDTNGVPIATQNFAIQGMTVGTTPVGAASASMVAIVKGDNSVV